jgi:hypothetical protein
MLAGGALHSGSLLLTFRTISGDWVRDLWICLGANLLACKFD